MDEQTISDRWLPHLKTQFETARPILFTGAGFSLEVRNIRGELLPSYEELRARIWNLCFPGTAVEPGSLQDVFEHALLRKRKDLGRLLEESLTVDADTIPAWYEKLLNHPWQRYYTLNVDDLMKTAERKFELRRACTVISATAPKQKAIVGLDPTRELECIHLNGTLSDLPENVTFSLSQYMERLRIPDPWYIRFSGDLLTSPVVFIGTRLDEPPLWQHVALRRGRGPAEAAEFRHRSYLVTPSLDRTRQARLAEFNIDWVPMTGQEFLERVLGKLGESPAKGFDYLHVIGPRAGRGAATLREVSELATNPGEHSEFLMGSEPIWADLQSGRAITRACDNDTEQAVIEKTRIEGPKGILVITGTAGSGKSTSLKRISLALSTQGIRTGWVDRHSELTPYQLRAAMKAEHAPNVLAIDDADIYGGELASWAREIALTAPYPPSGPGNPFGQDRPRAEPDRDR